MRRSILLLGMAVVILVPGCEPPEDHTSGMSDVCKVHGCKITKSKIPILYGLIRPDDRARAMESASMASFPNAPESVLGGCMIKPANVALLYVCPQCQVAKERWQKENPIIWQRPEKNSD